MVCLAYGDIPMVAGVAILIALLFNVAITTLFFLFSRGLQAPTLMATSKEEFAQLFLSVFLVVGIFVAWGLLQAVSNAVFNADGCANHIQIAKISLEMLKSNYFELYRRLYLYEAVIAILSSFSFSLPTLPVFVFIFSVHISPFAGLVLLTNVHIMLVDSMGYGAAAVLSKIVILDFVYKTVPALFIPLGLVLRAFPWFRNTGSSILALSIALYFAFPLAMILSNYIIFDIYQPSNYFLNFDADPGAATLCNQDPEQVNSMRMELIELFGDDAVAVSSAPEPDKGFFTQIWDFAAGAIETVVSGITFFLKTFWFMLQSGIKFLSPFSYLHFFYVFLVQELVLFSQFLVVGLVTTVMEFIIVVTAYRSISSAISGETEVFGLSKLV